MIGICECKQPQVSADSLRCIVCKRLLPSIKLMPKPVANEHKRDKLILRHNFIHNRTGVPRTNTLKAWLNAEGELQIYIDNGKKADGRDNYAAIRLNAYQIETMLEFLQRNKKEQNND